MQLVQLQETVATDPKQAVVAVSYDPVEVLADFAAAHGITYPLLSDVGSTVMGELGVLNTEMEQERAFLGMEYGARHRGLPFPGVFALDGDGVVEAKHFERSHRNRASSDVLVGGSRGKLGEVAASGAAAGVRVTADVGHRRFFPNQVSAIRVQLDIEPGLHVYVPPIPDGYRVLDVSVEAPDGFYWEQPELPEGEPYAVQGLADQFRVVGGSIEIMVPFHVHESVGDVTPEVVVSFQTCTDTLCHPPDLVRLSLPLIARPKM